MIQLWVFLLPVCLSVSLSSYVLVPLSWHISARNFITLQVAQWVGMTVNHSKQFCVCLFFHPARSSKWWLLFETWLPLLQGQWRVQSCSSSILSVLHSERFDHWVNVIFFTQRAWRQISPSRNVTGWTGLMSAKINAHARKCTGFF